MIAFHFTVTLDLKIKRTTNQMGWWSVIHAARYHACLPDIPDMDLEP
jgi:hypothetical protein